MTKHPARDLRRDLRKAGLPTANIDFHALRAAHVTLIIEGGADVKTGQTLARHASPDMTMNVYAKARDPRLLKAVEQLSTEILKPVIAAILPQQKVVNGEAVTVMEDKWSGRLA